VGGETEDGTIYTHTHTYYIYTYIHTYIYIFIYIRTQTHTHIYIYTYVYIYIHIHICIYIYISYIQLNFNNFNCIKNVRKFKLYLGRCPLFCIFTFPLFSIKPSECCEVRKAVAVLRLLHGLELQQLQVLVWLGRVRDEVFPWQSENWRNDESYYCTIIIDHHQPLLIIINHC